MLVAPRYFGHVDRSKELVLKQNLAQVRDAIDKFKSDTGKYPTALDDLVKKRYLRAMPMDPVTDSTESWVVVSPESNEGASGIANIRSGAQGNSADGTAYADW
jgi:general secretion pathway protein G